jgi:hypothetical protein
MASKRRLRVLKHAAGVHFNIFRFEQKKGPSKGPSIFVPTIPIEKSSWLGVSIDTVFGCKQVFKDYCIYSDRGPPR